MTVIKKPGMPHANVIKREANKNVMPLIAYMHAWAQGANEGNTSHMQAPAHLNWQSVGTKSKAKQTAQAPNTQGQVIVGLRHRPNARNPPVVCAQLCPFGRRRPRGNVQPLPELMMLASKLGKKMDLSMETVLDSPALAMLNGQIGPRSPGPGNA